MTEVAIATALAVILAFSVWFFRTDPARKQRKEEERLRQERLARKKAKLAKVIAETPDYVLEKRARARARARGQLPPSE